MSGATNTRAPKPNPLAGFEDTVKDFWVSRPRRPVSGRKIAGVAAAIGNRYGIDPVVVRVALVAGTVFGGSGVLVYLLGWLLFPDERDQVSAAEGLIGRGRTTTSPAFTIVLGVALLPTLGWSFGGGWFDGGGLIGCALIAVALYLLHRGRGQDNRPVAPPVGYSTAMPYGTAGPDAAFSMTTPQVATETSTPDAAAPAWDPLSADPSAWDLPGFEQPMNPPPPPRPAPPAPRRRKSKIGGPVFVLAILVAAAGVVLNLDGQDWFSLRHIVGLTLGVLGLGLVAGSFVRGARGLIGLAVPLAIAGMVLTSAPFSDLSLQGGVGNLDATPRTPAQLQPLYERAAGNIDLDLTQLPPAMPVRTRVHISTGNATVIVPEKADVTFTCATGAGSIDCLTAHESGVGHTITQTDVDTDGPGGQQITLTVENGAGNVEVRRG
ncbi:PspC domain-containing protein [Amycolatopsis sp. H20-H5]|uniref:PspC domain-containing protein n=1 Tax=Amycolatopsis sp. H20-H5 TaxID=3046309 RepID=UPI002DB5E12F|nr:PspC domain-containing protein [Amycolatopsis sp. H20-H5]MEC3982025.1 PspC domain-containing protein [Amycolatopsis sp. H20-H5]